MPTTKVHPQTIDEIFAKMVVTYPADNQAKKRLAAIGRIMEKVEKARYSNSLLAFERFQLNEDDDGGNGATLELRRERTHLKMLLSGYKEIDPEFLTWRKKTDSLPAFAIIDADENENRFSITVEPMEDNEYELEFSPDLPGSIQNLFAGSLNTLDKMARQRKWNAITITAAVSGFIDNKELRKNVKKAQQSEIFDTILVIGEVKEWTVNRATSVKKDPIVVGWVENTEQMFVIGTFDLSSLEEHVLMTHQHQS